MDKKVPEACLQKNSDYTWCGNEVRPRNFVFTDVDYAIKHYASSTTVRACSECIARFNDHVTAKGSIVDLTPRYLRKDE